MALQAIVKALDSRSRRLAIGAAIAALMLVRADAMTKADTACDQLRKERGPAVVLLEAEFEIWAMSVLDGYDSRATINRQVLYAGAVLAAADISAIAGLAAFGSNSSALIGIPIGTAFLGAVAAVYQGDEKQRSTALEADTSKVSSC